MQEQLLLVLAKLKKIVTFEEFSKVMMIGFLDCCLCEQQGATGAHGADLTDSKEEDSNVCQRPCPMKKGLCYTTVLLVVLRKAEMAHWRAVVEQTVSAQGLKDAWVAVHIWGANHLDVNHLAKVSEQLVMGFVVVDRVRVGFGKRQFLSVDLPDLIVVALDLCDEAEKKAIVHTGGCASGVVVLHVGVDKGHHACSVRAPQLLIHVHISAPRATASKGTRVRDVKGRVGFRRAVGILDPGKATACGVRTSPGRCMAGAGRSLVA